MTNEIIEKLANDIVKKFNSLSIDLSEEIKTFLASDISVEDKGAILEQLYLLQLYGDAYISPDPRVKTSMLIGGALRLLKANGHESVQEAVKIAKGEIAKLEHAETNPLETAKREIEDQKKFEGVRF